MNYMPKYDYGIAFIVEGSTEKVFYSEYVQYCCRSYSLEIERVEDGDGINYVITRPDKSSVLVKLYSVNAITQMTNSATWFMRACFRRHSSTKWTVFLCYDTDEYNSSITKFHEGDWLELREEISSGASGIVDLAAEADIEDVMLCDLQGVLEFLHLDPSTPMPSGGKGKSKMKKLYKSASRRRPYHEGDRALPLIQSLDMEHIERSAPIPLASVKDAILGSERGRM